MLLGVYLATPTPDSDKKDINTTTSNSSDDESIPSNISSGSSIKYKNKTEKLARSADNKGTGYKSFRADSPTKSPSKNAIKFLPNGRKSPTKSPVKLDTNSETSSRGQIITSRRDRSGGRVLESNLNAGGYSSNTHQNQNTKQNTSYTEKSWSSQSWRVRNKLHC